VHIAAFLFGVAISYLNVVIFAGQSPGQPAGFNGRVTGRVGSRKSWPVPSLVRAMTLEPFSSRHLACWFNLMPSRSSLNVKVNHKSKFKVTGGNVFRLCMHESLSNSLLCRQTRQNLVSTALCVASRAEKNATFRSSGHTVQYFISRIFVIKPWRENNAVNDARRKPLARPQKCIPPTLLPRTLRSRPEAL